MHEAPTPSPQRMLWIAYAQVIGIVLVVLGHSLHCHPGGETTLGFWKAIYSFHMPLFFFISGYLLVVATFKLGERWYTPAAFLGKKGQRLLVPLLFLTVVFFVPRCWMSQYADDPINLGWGSLLRSFYDVNAMVVPYLWYVETLFVLFALFYLWVALCRLLKGSFAAGCVTFFLVALGLRFSPLMSTGYYFVHNIAVMAPVFSLGAIMGLGVKRMNYVTLLGSVWVCIVAWLAWAMLFYLFDNMPLRWLWMPLAAIIGSLSLACLLEKHDIRWLAPLAGATFIIYLLSWFCNVGAQQLLSSMWKAPWWVFTAISVATSLIIPTLLLRYLQHHSHRTGAAWLLFLLGHATQKKKQVLQPG